MRFPNRIIIELTNRCNITCSYCPRSICLMDDQDMPLSHAFKLINEAAQLGVSKVAFFFRGEPLLYPHLAECIRYAKEQGIPTTQISTNAFLLDQPSATALLESGIDFISFSISEPYVQINAADKLNTAEKNIMAFLEQVRKYKSKGMASPLTQVSIVESILEQEKPFVSYWQQLVDIVRIYDTHDEMGQSRNLELSKPRLPCRKPYEEMTVMATGNVVSCSYDWLRLEPLGNTMVTGLSEIWDSPAYGQLRLGHEKNVYSTRSACYNCDQWMMYHNNKGYLGKLYKSKGDAK